MAPPDDTLGVFKKETEKPRTQNRFSSAPSCFTVYKICSYGNGTEEWLKRMFMWYADCVVMGE